MSEGHYCTIHKTKFFKTEKMYDYAHPIKDKDGKTIEWCNEKDLEKVKNLPPQSSQELRPEDQAIINEEVKTKDQRIAEHVWWKELGEMIRTKDIDMTKPAGKAMRTAYYAQMLSVLDIKIENK